LFRIPTRSVAKPFQTGRKQRLIMGMGMNCLQVRNLWLDS
jgi:hypothetical protein